MSLCVCPICGAEKRNLTKHINMLHKLTKEDFLKLYPNTKMVSEETSDLISKSLINNWKDETYANKCSSYAKSDRNIGGTNLKGVPKSEETKQKMKNFANSKRGKEIRSNNLSNVLNELWKDEVYVQSKRDLGRNQMLKNMNDESYGHKRYKYNGTSFRSTWEVNTAKVLDSIGIKYEYEKYRFNYKINDIEHIYIPDFYLVDYKIFLEVKPQNFINEITDIKLESVKKSGYKIFYVTTNETNKLFKFLKSCVELKPI